MHDDLAGPTVSIGRRGVLGASLLVGATLTAPLLSRALAADALPLRRTQVEANDVSLHVVEQGAGPAVLFCHGFPDTSATWRQQMQAVAAAGYRAIALDMRGYGLSDAPADANLYTSLQITADLVGVLDALQVPSAVLVGHDWGATHVWQAILKRPDRFRAAVGVSVPFSPRGDVSYYDSVRRQGFGDRYYAFASMKPEADALWAPAARTISSNLYWSSASPPASERWDPYDPAKNALRPAPVARPGWADAEYVDGTIRSFQRTGFHGGLNYYRAAQADFDLTAAWKGAVIWQPTLFVYGKGDKLTTSFGTFGAKLRQGLPGLVAEIGFDDCGHWVQHEAADKLSAALIDFLRHIGLPR